MQAAALYAQERRNSFKNCARSSSGRGSISSLSDDGSFNREAQTANYGEVSDMNTPRSKSGIIESRQISESPNQKEPPKPVVNFQANGRGMDLEANNNVKMQQQKPMKNMGICCETCNTRLVDMKRQALRYMVHNEDNDLSTNLFLKLKVPEDSLKSWSEDRCDVCTTHLSQLKQEVVAMVQSLEEAQAGNQDVPASNIPSLVGSRNPFSLQRPSLVEKAGVASRPKASYPLTIAAQAHRYLEESQRHPSLNSPVKPPAIHHPNMSLYATNNGGRALNGGIEGFNGHVVNTQMLASAPMATTRPNGVTSPPYAAATGGMSAAASFFTKAAQKFNISSKKKKQKQQPIGGGLSESSSQMENPLFPTNFQRIIRDCPPPAPPGLLKIPVKSSAGVGKVRVMLRVCPPTSPYDSGSFLNIDSKKKQVTIYDPAVLSNSYVSPLHRRTGVAAPKMFAFDSIFSQDASQTEICAGSVAEIVQSVVNGADGCLFCYGHAKLGKTNTMVGRDGSPQTIGIIPCAISWLYKLINDRKEKTGARFSVRVSAVEVAGKSENLRDLLAEHATGSTNGIGCSPALYLQDDPISGSQLINQSELRSPTPEQAAFYLDAALAARTTPASFDENGDEEIKNCHMLFTLHIYQYRVEKNKAGGMTGGRSRLHLIDLGSCEKLGGKAREGTASTGSLTLSALGNVIQALVNGAKHIPYRESKLTRCLQDSLGNLSCRTTMIAHISSSTQYYTETLSTVQWASRIHRMRKKKSKYSSTSSSGGESSCEEGRIRRPHVRLRSHDHVVTNAVGVKHSDGEYLSSSEQSCDTVIYMGPNGAISDRDLTDNEGPPSSLPILNPAGAHPKRGKSGSSGGEESPSSSQEQDGSGPAKLMLTPLKSRTPVSRAVAKTSGIPRRLPNSKKPSPPVKPRTTPKMGLMKVPMGQEIFIDCAPPDHRQNGLFQLVEPSENTRVDSSSSKTPQTESTTARPPATKMAAEAETKFAKIGRSKGPQPKIEVVKVLEKIAAPDLEETRETPPSEKEVENVESERVENSKSRLTQSVKLRKVENQTKEQTDRTVLKSDEQSTLPVDRPKTEDTFQAANSIFSSQPPVQSSEFIAESKQEQIVSGMVEKIRKNIECLEEKKPPMVKAKPAVPPRTVSIPPGPQNSGSTPSSNQKTSEKVELSSGSCTTQVAALPNMTPKDKMEFFLEKMDIEGVGILPLGSDMSCKAVSETSISELVSVTATSVSTCDNPNDLGSEMEQCLDNMSDSDIEDPGLEEIINQCFKSKLDLKEVLAGKHEASQVRGLEVKMPEAGEAEEGDSDISDETETGQEEEAKKATYEEEFDQLLDSNEGPCEEKTPSEVKETNSFNEEASEPRGSDLTTPASQEEVESVSDDYAMINVISHSSSEVSLPYQVDQGSKDVDSDIDQSLERVLKNLEQYLVEVSSPSTMEQASLLQMSDIDKYLTQRSQDDQMDAEATHVSRRRQHHVPDDHPLKRLSSLSMESCNTFASFNDSSRPTSFISNLDEETEDHHYQPPVKYQQPQGQREIVWEKMESVSEGSITPTPGSPVKSRSAPGSSAGSPLHSVHLVGSPLHTGNLPGGPLLAGSSVVVKPQSLALNGQQQQQVPLSLKSESPGARSGSTLVQSPKQPLSPRRTPVASPVRSPSRSTSKLQIPIWRKENDMWLLGPAASGQKKPGPKATAAPASQSSAKRSSFPSPVIPEFSEVPSWVTEGARKTSHKSSGSEDTHSFDSAYSSSRAGTSSTEVISDASNNNSLRSETSRNGGGPVAKAPHRTSLLPKPKVPPKPGSSCHKPGVPPKPRGGAAVKPPTPRVMQVVQSETEGEFSDAVSVRSCPGASGSRLPVRHSRSKSTSSPTSSKSPSHHPAAARSLSANGGAPSPFRSVKSPPAKSPPSQNGGKTSKLGLLPRSKSVSKSAPSLTKSPGSGKAQSPVKTNGGKVTCDLPNGFHHTDSDSGHESGAPVEHVQAVVESRHVAVEYQNRGQVLSPYSKLTRPRAPRTCSSGHGSDNSSTISDLVAGGSGVGPHKGSVNLGGGISSGYESMMRDSEVTASSGSAHDSMSDDCSSNRGKGIKMLRRKLSGSRTKRSESPSSSSRKSNSGSWRSMKTSKDGCEFKVYEVDNLEELKRKQGRTELDSITYVNVHDKKQERIASLKIKQQELKEELSQTQTNLMLGNSKWTFDLPITEEAEREAPGYTEALEKETEQLEERVSRSKARLMLVTCFDIHCSP